MIRREKYPSSGDIHNKTADQKYAQSTAQSPDLGDHKILQFKVLHAEHTARYRQEKHLQKELTQPINTNLEMWVGHLEEDRRYDHDIYASWKRPFPEVKRYQQIVEEIEASRSNTAVLFELIQNWTTATNFEHIASLLTFSPEEVEQLIKELDSGKLSPQSAVFHSVDLDKTVSWYPSLMEALTVDDIVPLVLVRKYLLEGTLKPSLRHLFIGLKRYFDREINHTKYIAGTHANNGSNKDETVSKKIAELSREKDAVYQALRKMNRPKKSITVFQAPPAEKD